MHRRHFAATLAAAAAGALAPAGAPDRPARELPTRPLGRGGPAVTILGLGGSHVGLAGSERAARELINTALEEGIRFFDTAESYQNGLSERYLGAGLKAVRGSVFLMSKTFSLRDRSRESARRHLEGTLERLQTDYLDLWQLHSVRGVADVDRAFGPGGAMEYIVEAKERGLVRRIGVTGHVSPEFNRRALHYWDRGVRFSTMQMPLNPIDYHQRSFERELLPELTRRGIGVIAMKTSADGALLRERICTIEECLNYVWSLPVSVAVVGMEHPALVRANAQLARAYAPPPEGKIVELRRRIASRARLDLEWYKRG